MNTGEWMTKNKIDKWLLEHSRPYPYVQADPNDEATIIGIQQAEAQAELEALKKTVVNFYLDDNTGELLTICQDCYRDNPTYYGDLTYVDKAGEWDICGQCNFAQNIPAWYRGEL